MADWSGYTTGPNYQGIVNSNANAQNAFLQGQDTAFDQGIKRDANTRANIASDQSQQMFPYQLDDARIQNAIKAQGLLNEMGGLAQDVKTPEEKELLFSNMRQRGIDTTPYDHPDWQTAVRKLQIVTGDTQRRLTQEMLKANIADKMATARKNDPFVENQAMIDRMRQLDDYERTLPQANQPQPGQFDSAGIPTQGGRNVAPVWGGASMAPDKDVQQTDIKRGGAPSGVDQNGVPYGPRPGQATPSPTNVTPNSGTFWSKTPEQQHNERMAIMFPHLAPVMRLDPATQAQIHYGNNIANNNGKIDMAQREGIQSIQGYHAMLDAISREDPEVVKAAIGPIANRETFQKIRASIPGMPQNLNWDRAYQLNLELHHLIENVGAGEPGANRSDAALANVMAAVGKGLESQTPEGLIKIIRDAENAKRRKAYLPEVPNTVSYIPQSWRDKYPGRFGTEMYPPAMQPPVVNRAYQQSQQPPQNSQGDVPPSLPQPKTQAEYDALPPGSKYIGKDGKPYAKAGQSSL